MIPLPSISENKIILDFYVANYFQNTVEFLYIHIIVQ